MFRFSTTHTLFLFMFKSGYFMPNICSLHTNNGYSVDSNFHGNGLTIYPQNDQQLTVLGDFHVQHE